MKRGRRAVPSNISRSDFRRLQSRMLSSAFAFAELSSKVTNNTSVVLLIEWKGKRLLFVGDAEWDTKFKDGQGQRRLERHVEQAEGRAERRRSTS